MPPFNHSSLLPQRFSRVTRLLQRTLSTRVYSFYLLLTPQGRKCLRKISCNTRKVTHTKGLLSSRRLLKSPLRKTWFNCLSKVRYKKGGKNHWIEIFLTLKATGSLKMYSSPFSEHLVPWTKFEFSDECTKLIFFLQPTPVQCSREM